MNTTNKEKLEALGIDLKRVKGSGKTLCPKCSHTRKKKQDPCLSVDIDEGVYTCHNDGCDFQGSVGYKPALREEKVYVRPKFVNNTKLSDKAAQWFANRGISQKTLTKMSISEGPVWMPQVYGRELTRLLAENMAEEQAKVEANRLAMVNTIQFPYYRDGEVINVKYRDKHKHFRMAKDAELIMFNLDGIKDQPVIVITEGEMDALSAIEAGFDHVTSVPNGATLKAVNLDYLDNCWHYFEQAHTIILATDDDQAGHNLREELARRLGYDRCMKVNMQGLKDLNEVLKDKGPDDVRSVLDNGIAWPISGVIGIDDVWDDLELIFEEGLKKGLVTGEMGELDELISYMEGQLTLVTGIPNHGKSRVVLQVACWLSLKFGWRWGIFSPEHFPTALFMAKISEILLGKKYKKGRVTDSEKQKLREFIRVHFHLIYPQDDNFTLENILEKAKSLVRRHGIKGMILDPWNKLEHNIEKGVNETTYVSKELDKLIKFNQRHMVHCFLVAHPAKMKKKKDSEVYEVPDAYDVSGSSNFANKCDNVLSVYRDFTTGTTSVYTKKIKHEHLGQIGKADFLFNINNGRFTPKGIAWDNGNWLNRTETVQLAMDMSSYVDADSRVSEFLAGNTGIGSKMAPMVLGTPDDEVPF